MEKRAIWDIFSLQEESQNPLRDKYGRFSYYASKHRDIFSPVVSEYLHAKGLTFAYPDNKKFAVCLSHDVDFLTFRKSGYLQNVLLSKSLLKGNFSEFKKHKRSPRAVNPVFSLERTLRLEKQFGATSSFYFLALEEGEQDFNYGLNEIAEELEMVKAAGCEIGLHGGHGVSEDMALMEEQKSRLEKAAGKGITGYRSHFLRFRAPHTWRLLRSSGFSHDTTLGYSDCAGYRNGMCHPFFPYDNEKKEFIGIAEVPLVVMDVTLFNHMQLHAEAGKKLCLDFLDKTAQLGGVLTFLWHNNNMQGHMGEFYSWFLAACRERNAWLTSTGAVADWCKEKGHLDKVRDAISELSPVTPPAA